MELTQQQAYEDNKSYRFKEYYEDISGTIFPGESPVKSIADELKKLLKWSKSIEILVIWPGSGKLEIPLLEVICSRLKGKRFKICLIEPNQELAGQFEDRLKQVAKRLKNKFFPVKRLALKKNLPKIESVDSRFHIILAFSVFPHFNEKGQLNLINDLDNYLVDGGLIFWWENNSWLRAVDGSFDYNVGSTLEVEEKWREFWKKFHGRVFEKGKININPIKDSDHSLVEFIYRNNGYQKIFQEEISIDLKKGPGQDGLTIKNWIDKKNLRYMNPSLTDGEYATILKGLGHQTMAQKLSKVSKNEESPKDKIQIFSFKKQVSKHSKGTKENRILDNTELKSLISYHFQNNLLLLFLRKEGVSSSRLFKELNIGRRFRSSDYEKVVLKRRLYILSKYLFKLIGKTIHMDYVLWASPSGDSPREIIPGSLPISFLHGKGEKYEKTYLGWYVLYFFSRKCLNIGETIGDFLFRNMPDYESIVIKKRDDQGENSNPDIKLTINENILEIEQIDMELNTLFPFECNKKQMDEQGIIELLGSKFKDSGDGMYQFDMVFDILKNENKELIELSGKIATLYEEWKEQVGRNREEIQKLMNILEGFWKKSSPKAKIDRLKINNLTDEFLKHIFTTNFINRGEWGSIRFKLNSMFKKEEEQPYEGFLLLSNVNSPDLKKKDIELIDCLIDDAACQFTAKDAFYTSYCLLKRDVSINALKSAIAAIMSRNMSHNIGSHVIADLVAKEPNANRDDLNSLYRYLQNRMDFIAQITAEIPQWTYPAQFHKGIMRIFYENYLLIDRIAISEGLKSYEWVEDWNESDRRGKIIIRTGIRSFQKGKGYFKWVINEYEMGQLKNDLQLAIPGGILGYHAFYIIIENILRNSAKHGYFGNQSQMFNPHAENKEILIIFNEANTCQKYILNENSIKQPTQSEGDADFNNYKAVLIESTCLEENGLEYHDDNKTLSIKLKEEAANEMVHPQYLFIGCRKNCEKVKPQDWEKVSVSFHMLSDEEWKQVIKIKDQTLANQRYDVLVDFLSKLFLRIQVRIDDMWDNDYAWITIWDNIPQKARRNFSLSKDKNKEVSGDITPDEIEERLNEVTQINLFGSLNDRFRRPLIKPSGDLLKENWGLAELKICAGYLQNRQSEEIGDYRGKVIDYGHNCFKIEKKFTIVDPENPNKGYPAMIIKAIPVNKSGDEIRSLKPGKIYFLGYRYWMKKPKIVAIVGGIETRDQAINIERFSIKDVNSREKLRKSGIYCLENDLDELITNKQHLDYEFLVINASKGGIFLEAIRKIFKTGGLSSRLRQTMLEELEVENLEGQEEKIFKWLSRTIECLPARIIIIGPIEPDIKDSWNSPGMNDIQEWICKRIVWTNELENVHIQVKEGNLKDYKVPAEVKYPDNKEPGMLVLEPEQLAPVLYNTWIRNHYWKGQFQLEVNFVGDSDTADITYDYIQESMWQILDNLEARLKVEIDWKTLFLPFYCPKDAMPGNINWKIKCGKFLDKIVSTGVTKKIIAKDAINQKNYIYSCSYIIHKRYPSSSESDVKEVLYGIFNKKSVSKVPAIFQNDPTEGGGEEKFILTQTYNDQPIQIKYSRHETPDPGKIMKHKADFPLNKYFYQESLTGAAPHFNLLYSTFTTGNAVNRAEMYFNLVENGLMRMLIADERISNYVEKNQKMKDTFLCAGITIIEDIEKVIAKVANNNDFFAYCTQKKFKEIKDNAGMRHFDLFIIHQGVIDKMKLQPGQVEDLINEWKKKYFSFVIVTSGRGTPSNVPINTRFLPFSILESSFITPAISKFIAGKSAYKSLARRN